MSKVAITGNALGTGTLTIAAPNTNSDRTLTLPDTTAPILAGSGITLSASAPANTLVTDASGNVGVGTSSPAQKLDVVGNAAVSGQLMAGTTTIYSDGAIGTPRLQWVSNVGAFSGAVSIANATSGLNHWVLRNPNGNLGAIGTDGTSVTFYMAGSEALRLGSTGNLLLGGTTEAFNSRMLVRFTASGTSATGINVWGGGASGQTFIGFTNSGGGGTGSITQSGAGTAYNTSSDYRLKHDIQPMTGALARVAALKPCTYKWNADNSEDEGFIAHELAEVCPSAVSGEKDAVNEDGSIKPQGIDTSFLVATLTAAIQELNAKVDAQAAEIAALKGQA